MAPGYRTADAVRRRPCSPMSSRFASHDEPPLLGRDRPAAGAYICIAHAASPALAPTARSIIRQFCREHGAAPRVCDAAALAVTEAVANAVVHAYRDRHSPGEVEISARRDDAGLHVIVRDCGTGMTPHPGSGGAGLGLPLISSLADRIEVVGAIGEGTELRMTFQHRGDGDDDDAG